MNDLKLWPWLIALLTCTGSCLATTVMSLPLQGLTFDPATRQILSAEGEMINELDHPIAGSCAGSGQLFLADGLGALVHYVVRDAPWRLAEARRLPVNPDVTHCAVWQDQLIYVDPRNGVYQTEAKIEGDGIHHRLSLAPEFLEPGAFLVERGGRLYLSNGVFREEVVPEVEVRNNPLHQVQVGAESEVPRGLDADTPGSPVVWPSSPPRLLVPDQIAGIQVLDQSGRPGGRLSTPGMEQVAIRPQGEDAWLLLGVLAHEPTILIESLAPNGDKEALGRISVMQVPRGICHDPSSDDVFVLTRDYEVQRLAIQVGSGGVYVEQHGSFHLSSPISHCVVDEARNWLYVLENSTGVWVFDLAADGLTYPRTLTTDQMVEGLIGLALMSSANRLATWSTGDGALLLFDLAEMKVDRKIRLVANLNQRVDGVFETRGLAWLPPGPTSVHGTLIIHDVRNRLPADGQNYKFVPVESLLQ